jgi:DnaK suppressor protein
MPEQLLRAIARYAAMSLTCIKERRDMPAHDDPPEVFMSNQITAPFKKQLLAQRAGLLEQLAALRGGKVGRAEASAEHFGTREPDSRAQMESERDLEFTLDARESAELDAIDAALRRIDEGSFGVCTDCGAEIPAARLHAAPETLRCIRCQEKTEHTRRA